MSLSYTEAFARFGASLTNQQWSVSAFGPDGSLVVSLWQDGLKRGEKGTLVYTDTLSQWKGNAFGRSELQKHLRAIQASGATIKLVIAHPASLAEAAKVGQVADESAIKKTFSIREDIVGKLVSFDDDTLRIVFARAG